MILSLCPVVFLLTVAGAVFAQIIVGAKAGIINCIEGEVFLDGKALSPENNRYLLMQIGQRLATKKGRAEVLLGPDVYLRLGENALLQIDGNQLDDTRLLLEQGSALIEIVQGNRGILTRIRIPHGTAAIKKEGLYRFDADPAELRVYGGTAAIAGLKSEKIVKKGEKIRLGTDSGTARFDVKVADSLHQWAARRSFDLFNATASSRTQNHWRSVSLGWAYNANYRMRFHSAPLMADWVKGRLPTLAEATAAAEQARREREEQEYRRRQALKAKIEAETIRNGQLPY